MISDSDSILSEMSNDSETITISDGSDELEVESSTEDGHRELERKQDNLIRNLQIIRGGRGRSLSPAVFQQKESVARHLLANRARSRSHSPTNRARHFRTIVDNDDLQRSQPPATAITAPITADPTRVKINLTDACSYLKDNLTTTDPSTLENISQHDSEQANGKSTTADPQIRDSSPLPPRAKIDLKKRNSLPPAQGIKIDRPPIITRNVTEPTSLRNYNNKTRKGGEKTTGKRGPTTTDDPKKRDSSPLPPPRAKIDLKRNSLPPAPTVKIDLPPLITRNVTDPSSLPNKTMHSSPPAPLRVKIDLPPIIPRKGTDPGSLPINAKRSGEKTIGRRGGGRPPTRDETKSRTSNNNNNRRRFLERTKSRSLSPDRKAIVEMIPKRPELTRSHSLSDIRNNASSSKPSRVATGRKNGLDSMPPASRGIISQSGFRNIKESLPDSKSINHDSKVKRGKRKEKARLLNQSARSLTAPSNHSRNRISKGRRSPAPGGRLDDSMDGSSSRRRNHGNNNTGGGKDDEKKTVTSGGRVRRRSRKRNPPTTTAAAGGEGDSKNNNKLTGSSNHARSDGGGANKRTPRSRAKQRQESDHRKLKVLVQEASSSREEDDLLFGEEEDTSVNVVSAAPISTGAPLQRQGTNSSTTTTTAEAAKKAFQSLMKNTFLLRSTTTREENHDSGNNGGGASSSSCTPEGSATAA